MRKAINLQLIHKDNWEEVIRLRVKDEQLKFMATNLYSIAESQFLDDFHTRAIFIDSLLIGFTMFGIDGDDHNYWIYRFMIDEKYQGKGYGVQGIREVINEIKKINIANIPYIMIGYHPENLGAKYVYKKAGFVETEVAPWGEQLALYKLNE
ncbi:Spermine/spermidine acetyltransferase [Mycobacteroides abscessus subsp. abscessus]|nr:Spermine/spermidine acetyltransferase [Mycobacteroides abscessus subsp. abscessus]